MLHAAPRLAAVSCPPTACTRAAPCRPPTDTKSGPQAGAALRRRFLRALHPLQVVELPRQQPGPALQLFAGVAAHIRILVIGGDGSGERGCLRWRGGGGGALLTRAGGALLEPC